MQNIYIKKLKTNSMYTKIIENSATCIQSKYAIQIYYYNSLNESMHSMICIFLHNTTYCVRWYYGLKYLKFLIAEGVFN